MQILSEHIQGNFSILNFGRLRNIPRRKEDDKSREDPQDKGWDYFVYCKIKAEKKSTLRALSICFSKQ